MCVALYFSSWNTSPFQHSWKGMCVCWICLVVLFPSVPVLKCGGKTCHVQSYRSHLTTLTTPPAPCPLFPPRPSDLSLCSMRPRPVPDDEAHGEDGNNCPEQLYLSNGETSPCVILFPLPFLSNSSRLTFFIALSPFGPVSDCYCSGSGVCSFFCLSAQSNISNFL